MSSTTNNPLGYVKDICFESKRPNEKTLYPSNSIFVSNFLGEKENFCIGDKINILGFMPLKIEKSEKGEQTIIQLHSNLSDTLHAIFLKNNFGVTYSYFLDA